MKNILLVIFRVLCVFCAILGTSLEVIDRPDELFIQVGFSTFLVVIFTIAIYVLVMNEGEDQEED